MPPHDPSLTTIRTAAALDRGFTRGQLRGPGFTSVGHGLVRPAAVDDGPVWERIAAAVGLMTDGCVLGGWAALWAQGNTWFDGRRGGLELPALVHCGRGSRIRKRAGVEAYRGTLLADEVQELDGLRVTTLARAAFDEMCRARSLADAVVTLDMATSTTTRSPHTTVQAIESVFAQHHKVRGVVRGREALRWGSTRSASPWETRTRLVAIRDAGISGWLVNAPVFDLTGALLGVADLFDPESGFVVETDGDHHREVERHADDNRREEGFERAGSVVVRISPLDHADQYAVAGRIRSGYRDAQRSTRRDWTLAPPEWWHRWPPARRWD